MTEKLVVKNLFKIFGSRPEAAMKLLAKGEDKDSIFAKTGQTAGVVDANFAVEAGEIFVIMGLSGSGKSTLVRLLNRLIEPTAGEILIDGNDIAKMSPSELLDLRRKDMSMVFQSFALMPHMTVLQNAAFGLEIAGVTAQDRGERALEALDQVGLSAYANSYPSEMSGGMQQRVGLARALANDPTIMLMDEAFSALDPLIRSEMQDELLKLQAEHERTIIFISHDLDEAMRIGDRIAIMEGGRVVQIGTPEEILRNPADEYVQSFFRGVDVSRVLSAGDIARNTQVTVIDRHDHGVRSAIRRLREYDRDHAYVVDRKRVFHGVVSLDSLSEVAKGEDPTLGKAIVAGLDPIPSDTLVGEVLTIVAQAPCGVPVVDDRGRYMGVISRASLLETLDREENGSVFPDAEEAGEAEPAMAAQP
jgi:glycine betaine/proline transport system ATP-binding protein